MKERSTNFELLRIISMFFIVIYHVILHGQVLNNTSGHVNSFYVMLMCFVTVHVNLFVLITGYFQYNKEFKLKKWLSINNSAWFYRILIVIVLLITGLRDVSDFEIIKSFLPIDFNFYWFVRVYLLLYLITPFLNKLINSVNKREYKNLLFVSFFIVSIIPIITNSRGFDISLGLSLYHFIFLYFLGAYLHKHPFDIKNKLNDSVFKERTTYVFIFILMVMISFIMNVVGKNISLDNEIIKEVGNLLVNASTSYGSPFVIIQTVAFFLLFKTFNFKNKFINTISLGTLGVYLLHDNALINRILYQKLGVNQVSSLPFVKGLLIVILASLFIFITGFLIEHIRLLILKFFKCVFKRNK